MKKKGAIELSARQVIILILVIIIAALVILSASGLLGKFLDFMSQLGWAKGETLAN